MTRMMLTVAAAVLMAGAAQGQYPRPMLKEAEGKRVDKGIEYTLTFDKDIKPVNAMIALEWVREVVETDHTVTATNIRVKGKTAVVTCEMNGFPKRASYVSGLKLKSAGAEGAVYEMTMTGTFTEPKLKAFMNTVGELDAQTRFAGSDISKANLGMNYSGDETRGEVKLTYRDKK